MKISYFIHRQPRFPHGVFQRQEVTLFFLGQVVIRLRQFQAKSIVICFFQTLLLGVQHPNDGVQLRVGKSVDKFLGKFAVAHCVHLPFLWLYNKSWGK